jgi:predicted permease
MSVSGLWRRLRSSFGRSRFDKELDEEIRLHLELRAGQLRKSGMSAEQAAHAAHRRFGNVTGMVQASRDAATFAWTEAIAQDLRYAVRILRKAPGFSLGAVSILALGIGANATMFSVLNATLLQPLGFSDPDRLVTVWKGRIDNPKTLNIVSLPNFLDWKSQNDVFEEMALFDSAGRGYNLTSHGEPEQVLGLRVTASFFPVLGVQPMLGRTFISEEEDAGHSRVVVLSYGLWVRRFGRDPALVGKSIQIDGAAHTVVGVMPPNFVFQFWSAPRQLWVPAGWTPGDHQRGSNSFVSVARLKSGVQLADARSEMDVIGRKLAAAYPNENAGQTIRLVPIGEFGLDGVRPLLYAMLGVVGFVLLIACVNIANLMLARAATRERELAIRRALGAGHGRLLRQLLVESVVLAGAGGACGLMLASWITQPLLSILPNAVKLVPMRPMGEMTVDAVVLVFTAGISIASGLLFGLAPALSALKNDVNQPLKEGSRASTSKNRLRYGLVASEFALTLVVLAGAGVMIVSVARLLAVDPGLNPRNVLVMQMSLPQDEIYYGPPGHPRFCDDLDRRVTSVPGVVSVSAIAHLPLSGGGAGRAVAIEGHPDPGPNRQLGAGYSVACPNILRTLGIQLIAGREFTFRDTLSAPGVAVVNESMAKRFWPGEDVVGKRFKIGQTGSDSPWLTVVGVFRNVRQNGLENEPGPSFLRPYNQAAWPSISIVTKTASIPQTLTPAVKDALLDIEPNQPVSNTQTMEEVVGASVANRRFPMLLLSLFAALALVLAAAGIAGVVAYSVSQRTNEIGVHMALGARSRDVLRLVLGDSLSWSLIGVAIGIVASFGLSRFLRALLFDVTATEPIVLGAVSCLLIAVSLVASYIPARRALRVDPASALRHD